MIQENDHNKYTTLYYLLLKKYDRGDASILETINEQKIQENLEKKTFAAQQLAEEEEDDEDYEFKQGIQTQTDRRGREERRPSSKLMQTKKQATSALKSVNTQRSDSGGRLR